MAFYVDWKQMTSIINSQTYLCKIQAHYIVSMRLFLIILTLAVISSVCGQVMLASDWLR